ncbi:MAG TPA: zf-HC2 domain-containing protein [Candidatus Krumholzibacteria bacterium]|nr:zf-HC2 domain-containing protein [Candidatus Krumholzibacteria bacterium]HRX51368.1 zf-HC2 domain-containing protein [Candidatus Krumholzibacteria bacterium]
MMTHQEAHALLNDLLDDRLTPDARAAVAAHAAGCSVCAAELDGLRRLREAAADLPAELRPAHDLWPGIAARLGDPDAAGAPRSAVRHRRPRLTLLAAAVVALALLAPWLRPDRTTPETAALDAGYAQVRRDGERLLAEGGLPPLAAAELRDGMSAIDGAVRETRQALDRTAGAPDQFRRLTACYRRKIDLLRQVVDRAART